MRIIDVPAAVEVEKIRMGGKDSWSMREYLMVAIDQYQPFGQGAKTIRQGIVIANKVEAMNGTLNLEDSEYDELKKAVEAFAFAPYAARKSITFIEAIEKAQHVETPVNK